MIRASDRLVIASAVAVLLISVTAQPLTQDTYLGQSWFLVLVLAGATVGLRRARLTHGFVLGAQTVLLVVLLFVLSSFIPNRGGPWYAHYAGLWAQGIEHMQASVAPMATNAGVKIIFVSVLGLLFVLTDLLVSGLDRPAWGIMPSAAAFAVPALGLPTDTWISAFLCLALGYLGILIADGLNRTGRWTRGLSRDSAEGYGSATTVVWRAAGLIGVPALIATAVLGLALPTLTVPGLSLGDGPGRGGPLQLSDPTLDLRRNLKQGENSVVLHYTSDRPGGLYLRMASLPSFDAGGWSNVQMRLESGTRLSVIPGVSGEPGERRTTEVSILDFGSEYLPLPYAPRTVQVSGDWAYDPNSLVVLSVAGTGNRTDAIRNLTYRVQSRDLEPSAAALARAVAGTPPDENTTAEVPPDLPEDLIELTREVTEDADTDAEKAWAIQEFLRGSEFTYSTDPQPGSGYRALQNFLLRDREGYCEQFATSMAMMARIVGIPSRVAVGFLPGKRAEGNTWEVSIHDMHAWPELFFAGQGWVRFEPTPATVTGTPPSWTLPQSESPTDQETLTPSDEPSADTSDEAVAPSAEESADPSQLDSGSGASWGRNLLVAGIGLLVLAILAAPATLRVRRRAARLSGGPGGAGSGGSRDSAGSGGSGSRAPEELVEDAWAELRDTVIDYGGTWPAGSPRAIGSAVGKRLDPPESEAIGRVAVLVERGRYARTLDADDLDGVGELPAVTHQIRRGLAPTSRWRRLIATLAPKSLFRRP